MFNWYKQSMSLDPNAWEYEENPARLRKDLDSVRTPYGTILQPQDKSKLQSNYFGVHFTPNEETAAVYACGKATESDPPVIIELSPQDLVQVPDIDAQIDTALRSYLEEEANKWKEIIKKNKRDIKKTADELYNSIDHDSQMWEFSDDVANDAIDIVEQTNRSSPPSVIITYLADKSPEQTISLIKSLISGNIPDEFMIAVVNQFRVLNQVGNVRVKSIYQIDWIDFSYDPHNVNFDMSDEELEENGLHKDGDDIRNDKGQKVLGYEDLDYGGQWLQATKILYENKQEFLPGYEMSNDSVYHGTTLSRAMQAYPELIGNKMITA